MIRHAVFIILGTALAGCAIGPDGVAPLGPDHVISGGSYSTGGGLTVAMDLREYQGQTLVCGVWAQSDRQFAKTRDKARNVMGSGSVAVGGRTILRGLGFMNEVSPMADYTGQEAGCRLIDRPWQPGATERAEIRLPQQPVHVEKDEAGSFEVRFRQTGPGAGGAQSVTQAR